MNNDAQHNKTWHNDTQYKVYCADCYYVNCNIFTVTANVVMLSVDAPFAMTALEKGKFKSTNLNL